MLDFIITMVIFTWLVSAITAGVILSNRGGNGFGGFVAGLFFGVFAIPIVMTTRRLPRWDEKPCEACREIIRKAALVCPHCTRSATEAAAMRREANKPPENV